MSNATDSDSRGDDEVAAEVRAVRPEYADEEAEAAELEAAENAAALEVPLSLRVTRDSTPRSADDPPPHH